MAESFAFSGDFGARPEIYETSRGDLGFKTRNLKLKTGWLCFETSTKTSGKQVISSGKRALTSR